MDIFLSILGLLGIVIAGVVIIVILCDLVLALLYPKTRGMLFGRKREVHKSYGETQSYQGRPKMLEAGSESQLTYNENNSYTNSTYNTLSERQYSSEITPVKEESFSSISEHESSTIDFNKAEEEEKMLAGRRDEEEEELAESRRRIIEERRREYEQTEEQKEEEEEDNVDRILNEIFDEDDKEAEEVQEETEEIEEIKEEVKTEETTQEILEKTTEEDEDEDEGQKVIEVDEAYYEQNRKLLERIEELERRLNEKTKEEREIISNLERQVEESKTVTNTNTTTTTTIVVPGMATGSVEEIENRLEILRARLKQAERELKINKKEYIPLRRVSATLDGDKKKLRRKEAMVAKQKVLLYGVNNYVDIDEDKAKKLAEDLDLLEGLRLSVQHCEEVMANNKERYPILERTNKILVNLVAELKSDVALLEIQLAQINANNNDENNA